MNLGDEYQNFVEYQNDPLLVPTSFIFADRAYRRGGNQPLKYNTLFSVNDSLILVAVFHKTLPSCGAGHPT